MRQVVIKVLVYSWDYGKIVVCLDFIIEVAIV